MKALHERGELVFVEIIRPKAGYDRRGECAVAHSLSIKYIQQEKGRGNYGISIGQ